MLAGRIEYDPLLPPWRDQLTQRTPMGSVIKCNAIYDEPFWRAEGLSGQATGDGEGARVVFDNSPPDGSPGILLGFLEGDGARRLGRADPGVRRQAVLDSFVRYFGPKAAHPVEFVELDWQAEPWSGGCYGTLFGPNVWTRYGPALREPVGPHPLGRHRDRQRVVGLHGRGGVLGPAGRGRGARRPGLRRAPPNAGPTRRPRALASGAGAPMETHGRRRGRRGRAGDADDRSGGTPVRRPVDRHRACS